MFDAAAIETVANARREADLHYPPQRRDPLMGVIRTAAPLIPTRRANGWTDAQIVEFLKAGSNLANDLLRATQHTEVVIAGAETQRRMSMQDAAELADRLADQMSTAASQSAEQLDVRIAKIERLGRDVGQLAADFASTHAEFKYTRDSFQKFIETEMRVCAIEFLARAREQLNPQPWRLYTISAVQTALIIGLFIWR